MLHNTSVSLILSNLHPISLTDDRKVYVTVDFTMGYLNTYKCFQRPTCAIRCPRRFTKLKPKNISNMSRSFNVVDAWGATVGDPLLEMNRLNYFIVKSTYWHTIRKTVIIGIISVRRYGRRLNYITGRYGLLFVQMLSLNLSNVVLMLVLKGLIWGASYMQTGGGKGRMESGAGGLSYDGGAITETDLLLFLGYLVADESGHYDCLNRVACEQPARAESYLRTAEMMWKTAKMLDGWDGYNSNGYTWSTRCVLLFFFFY